MDINFPLLLVIAVFVSGIVWLFDLAFLAKNRRQAIVAVDQQFSELDVSEQTEGSVYQVARTRAEREPLMVEYAKSFFPVLFIVLILRSFLFEPFQIPSGSMIPTLEVGDFILVNKFSYGIRLPVTRTKVIDINDPKRGDVMVFFPPHKPDTYYIKRVVGLPGDKIQYINNVLFINGELMPQKIVKARPPANPEYIWTIENLMGVEHQVRKAAVPGQLSRSGHWIVPAGHYFMIGDNRDDSFDSRGWALATGDPSMSFVPESAIVGKAFAVWMHWPKFLSIPSFSRVGSIQ